MYTDSSVLGKRSCKVASGRDTVLLPRALASQVICTLLQEVTKRYAPSWEEKPARILEGLEPSFHTLFFPSLSVHSSREVIIRLALGSTGYSVILLTDPEARASLRSQRVPAR